MKVILAMVLSVDGKSTKGDQSPSKWASKEDQDYFFKLMKENNLVVMSGQAFARANKAVKPVISKLKIILTREPKKYEKYHVPGQLEFTNESPRDLIKRLEALGFKQMLLVTGAALNDLFFKDKLVNEVWITLEPSIFGSGNEIIVSPQDIKLKLENVTKLNENGTLLLKYHVNKQV